MGGVRHLLERGDRRWYAEHQAGGSPMEFRNLDTLFGWVLRHREPIVTNDAVHDLRGGGIPAGHPALRSFLGMPLERDGELVGMFALANPPQGFTTGSLDRLAPLAAAATTLIAAYRTEAA